MKTLFIGFKGKNNTSAQIVNQLDGDVLLLTNSFSGLETDILSVAEPYDSVYMFGVDSLLNGTLRIEKRAALHGIFLSSDYDIARLSDMMDSHNIVHSISDAPTQYLCNAAYYHMLCKNRNTVFLHIPSAKGMNDELMERLLTLFRKKSQDA